MLSWLGHLESKARIKSCKRRDRDPAGRNTLSQSPCTEQESKDWKCTSFIRNLDMSKITEGWSQLCQHLSSSLEQPNPQWLSQQSHGPLSVTLHRNPCLQHQLCLAIQQLRPAFHPQATTFHSTFLLQIHSGKGRHRAGECCTLSRTQEPEHSSWWRGGSIGVALTTAVIRRQGEAEGSAKAVATSAQERLHCSAPASS